MANTDTGYLPETAAGWELYLMRLAARITTAEKDLQRLHELRGIARTNLVLCQKAEGIPNKVRNDNH